ncbi:NAD(P)-binding protein [Amniculicola lignicola CBS 123094]|uniref:NAD(P)-binding protein n=1 Tax=Amniculicola lignicola CBS 123094 TaxID=1392246 RepID=A0A6A5X0A2_9PLEO|nr:NAD(P)-binding protein [Amniculicola lignicola CBS 123094]
MSKAILVVGATGKQGGAVVNALLKANTNIQILAVTRDAKSTSAQKLQQKSSKIKLVTGDMKNVPGIFKTAKEATQLPIWGTFSVQVLFGPEEERQGKSMIDEAVKNDVKHFVYTSVDRGGDRSDEDPTIVPHFITKHNIEKHLYQKSQESGMTYTVLRPVAFMDNLTPNFFGKVFTTAWQSSLGKTKKLQLVATSDIGFFAAEAFLKPEEWKGRKISLAGDELTFDQAKSIFEKKTGKTLPTTFTFLTRIILYMVKEFGLMYKWFGDVGYEADIQAVKTINPRVKDFGTWLETESAWKSG